MVRGIKMKHIYNIIFTIVLAMISNQTYAAIQMCSANDAVSVVLDASIAPTNVITYPAVKSWKAVYDYGTVLGQKACVKGDNNYGYNNKIYDVLPTSSTGADGVCCCRIDHPIKSKWYCLYYVSLCSSTTNCADLCANDASTRRQLFNSAN